MKLKSRSTLGLVIGGVQVIGFLVVTIYIIVVLSKLHELSSKDADFRNDDVTKSSIILLYVILVTGLIITITSVLLIIGIIKRRSILMKPWIFAYLCGIVLNIVRIIEGMWSEYYDGDGNIVLDLILLGLQIFIFKLIYALHKEIQDKSSSEQAQSSFSNI